MAGLADLADLEQIGILLGGGGVNELPEDEAELPEDEAEQQRWSECSASLNQSLTSMLASCYQKFVELRDCWRSMCPLSKHWALRGLAFASFLENASTIGVMAVLTLNIYAATYFAAWAEHDSICVVGKDNTFPDHLKYWVKAIAVGLPFAASHYSVHCWSS